MYLKINFSSMKNVKNQYDSSCEWVWKLGLSNISGTSQDKKKSCFKLKYTYLSKFT